MSVRELRLDQELLRAPAQLALLKNDPRTRAFPAWEIAYPDLTTPPRAVVGTLKRMKVVERGPVRAAIEVERSRKGSTVVQRWSLAAGEAGDRLECDVRLD